MGIGGGDVGGIGREGVCCVVVLLLLLLLMLLLLLLLLLLFWWGDTALEWMFLLWGGVWS
jgi:hypothetical protein